MCIGKVESSRGKLLFTSRSFEVETTKLPEFFEQLKKLGENLVKIAEVEENNRIRSEREHTPLPTTPIPGEAGPSVAAEAGTALSTKTATDSHSTKNKGKILGKTGNFCCSKSFFLYFFRCDWGSSGRSGWRYGNVRQRTTAR